MDAAFDWDALEARDVPNSARPNVDIHCESPFHKLSCSLCNLNSRVRVICPLARELCRLKKDLKDIWGAT